MPAIAVAKCGRAPSRDTVQSIGRAADLLRLIATRGWRGARISDLVTWSGLPAPTAHRILKSLQAEGLVTHTSSREYRIGPLAYELGLAVAGQPHPAEICAPALEELSQRTRSLTHLLIPSGLEMVCIQRVVPPDMRARTRHNERARGRSPDWDLHRRWVAGVGVRRPIGVAAGGQAILSETPADAVEVILRANAGAYRRFHTAPDEVRSAVDRARRCGFAITTSGDPRHVHLGVAVRDGLGRAVAALKVLRPATGTHWADLDRVVAALHGAAATIQGITRFSTWGAP